MSERSSRQSRNAAEYVETLVSEPNPWTQVAGMFADDPLFDEWQAAIQDYRRRVDFMDEHGTVSLEILVRLTETPTGWRAETFGVATAEDDGVALRRLEARLYELFLDGAAIVAVNSSAQQEPPRPS